MHVGKVHRRRVLVRKEAKGLVVDGIGCRTLTSLSQRVLDLSRCVDGLEGSKVAG